MSNNSSQFGENSLNGVESLLVVILFLVFYNTLGLEWAIGAATLGSLWTAYSRRRRGLPIGKFLPIITILIVGRGVAGILTGNEDIYFGIGIAMGAAFGVVLAVSALVGRNLLTTAAPYIFDFPPDIQKHPIYLSTLNMLAYVGGIYYIFKAVFDLWLLSVSSTNEYVIIRTVISWPLGLAVFWGSLGYAAVRFSKIPNWEGFMVMMERQAVIYKQVFSKRFQRKSYKLDEIGGEHGGEHGGELGEVGSSDEEKD